jgi:SAM-dependent methyltransferase
MSFEHTCGICGNTSDNIKHDLREMFFGSREMFEYAECSACGVLELLNVPEDLSRFYPTDYYSFGPPRIKSSHTLKHHINKPFMSAYLAAPEGPARNLVSKLRRIPEDIAKLAKMRISRSSRILDVGCGAGDLLLLMERYGFTNLAGIDPFIEKDIEYPSGLTIRQLNVSDLNETYDVVMSHHVVEHIPNPFDALKDMARLTKPGGYVLIRMPNAASEAKDHYGVNWVQWDPPRHVFVHTPKTVEILAESAGLEVEEICCDSTGFQFSGSEGYLKDIPLVDQIERKDLFTEAEMNEWAKKSAELNAQNRGDSLCAILRKPA